MIVYEFPIQERVRTYLRLEHLYQRMNLLLDRDDAVDHHFALMTLFEALETADRADLKSDLLRDLERQKQMLASYRGNPAISEAKLNEAIADVDVRHKALNQQTGKAGTVVAESDWLTNIRARAGIPGGMCAFDLPAYYAWQHRTAQQRRQDLNRWMSSLRPLGEAVLWVLRYQRESGNTQKVVAEGGQFQQNLPQTRQAQLLRFKIDPALNAIPEISGNRIMVSVRMMRRADDDRLVAYGDTVPFELTLCY